VVKLDSSSSGWRYGGLLLYINDERKAQRVLMGNPEGK
jgi:hypothetical protein